MVIYWDFHAQPSLGFAEKTQKKRKYTVSDSCVDKNALLMSEVRGEWADWLEMIRKATTTQITTCYNQSMHNTISEHTTSNPEADGLQQQKTTPGAAPVR